MNTSPKSKLDRKKHIEKLVEGLTCPLPKHFEKLVPAQTWTLFWIIHSLSLLEQNQFLADISEDVIKFVSESSHKDGGYGGGPGQIAHIATTFATVNALITISSEKALNSIDRPSLIKFLHRLKQPDGSFAMHDDGEIDSRATYCALAVLRCLNIEDSILLQNVGDWILSCQTYEGGFGSVPGSEAHGGYTFCCVASLCLLNQLQRADLNALLRWLSNKQMSDDGGFCGRSNKLVDSCYSYWQGAVFPLVHPFLDKLIVDRSTNTKNLRKTIKTEQENEKAKSKSTQVNRPNTRSCTASAKKEELSDNDDNLTQKEIDDFLDSWMFDSSALQDYVLNQCQANGGLLRDKPGAIADFYHTCYALSGLSISQHQPDGSIFDIGCKPINIVTRTHPLFNLTPASLDFCFDHFHNKKIETFEEDSNA